MKNNNFLERQVIRTICFLLGGWAVLSSLQLFVVLTFTDYKLWFYNTESLNNVHILYIVIGLEFLIGLALLWSKIRHNHKLILWSLGAMWVYHLTLAMFNAFAFSLQGSSFMPLLFVGGLSVCLWAYYKQREDTNDETDRDLLI